MLCATDDSAAPSACRRPRGQPGPEPTWCATAKRAKPANSLVIELPHGGAWLRDGGIVDLAALVRELLRHPAIELRRDVPDDEPTSTCACWRRAGANRHRSAAVRGQAIGIAWPARDTHAPRAALCTNGYLTPPDTDGIDLARFDL